MNKTDILNGVTRTFHKTELKLHKHSPEIMVVTGIIGTVTAAVMACKATTKASEIVDELKDDLCDIHVAAETKPDEYTESDKKKDTTIVYAKAAGKFIKLYGPSIILGTASITSILAGHNITRKRNMALAAAYTAVDKSFKEYRNRVIDKFGEELDKELRFGVKAKEFTKTVTDENGNETTVTEVVNVIDDPNKYSDFARIFDDGCAGWTKDPEANLSFLNNQRRWANDKLKAQGYLFLNDVYEMLGIPKTKAGFQVGWIYDEKYPVGDNYVDFGIFDTSREKARDFVNGYERSIVLDFNVDGYILEHF